MSLKNVGLFPVPAPVLSNGACVVGLPAQQRAPDRRREAVEAATLQVASSV